MATATNVAESVAGRERQGLQTEHETYVTVKARLELSRDNPVLRRLKYLRTKIALYHPSLAF
jgi:hypothetical protein